MRDWRFAKRPETLRAAGLSLIAALLIAGCVRTQPPHESGTYTLAGKGAPVLVFQSGHGDDRRTWKDVLPQLAAHYTVFAPDRPGTAGNPPVPGPRDPCTVAAEQRAACRQPPPC